MFTDVPRKSNVNLANAKNPRADIWDEKLTQVINAHQRQYHSIDQTLQPELYMKDAGFLGSVVEEDYDFPWARDMRTSALGNYSQALDGKLPTAWRSKAKEREEKKKAKASGGSAGAGALQSGASKPGISMAQLQQALSVHRNRHVGDNK